MNNMASLGDLLAEDGFKTLPKQLPRLPPRSTSMPSHDKIRHPLHFDDKRRSWSLNCGPDRGVKMMKTLQHHKKGVELESSSSDSASQEIEDVFDEDDGYEGSRLTEAISYKQRYSNELFDEEESKNVPHGGKPYDLDSPLKAVVTILTEYITQFFHNESFRVSIYRRCTQCIGTTTQDSNTPAGILRKVIENVERADEGITSSRELKKILVQMSLIAGLNSGELKGGYTFGVANSHLAAVAHLYLGVVYKFQNKDMFSAKHLLQVFTDCPKQGRTVLLPELWDRIFLHRLSHLMEWYFRETESIVRASNRVKKLLRLEEVYECTLDMGTYQFANYYKECLVEGGEPPKLPSIPVPSESFPAANYGGISHSLSSDESQRPSSMYKPMVSRELYESVFRPWKIVEEADGIELEK